MGLEGFTYANIKVKRLVRRGLVVEHAKFLNGRYSRVPNKPNCWRLPSKTCDFELERIGANYELYGIPSRAYYQPGCRVKIADYNHSLRQWLLWPRAKAMPGVSLTKASTCSVPDASA